MLPPDGFAGTVGLEPLVDFGLLGVGLGFGCAGVVGLALAVGFAGAVTFGVGVAVGAVAGVGAVVGVATVARGFGVATFFGGPEAVSSAGDGTADGDLNEPS